MLFADTHFTSESHFAPCCIIGLTGRIWKCLIFWWWHKVSTNALGLLWLSRNRNNLTEGRVHLVLKSGTPVQIHNIFCATGISFWQIFEPKNIFKNARWHDANAAAARWELILIREVKTRMLSGPKALFFEDGVFTFLSSRSSSLATSKKLGEAQCLKAPTRRLVLAVWSSCEPPPSWCDHETRPESCGWLQHRHFVFVCVFFFLSTGLDKQQRNTTWANTQTSAGVDAGWEPVPAWRMPRPFVVREEKVPVLREDGCMGLGLPRTFIRWLRFWGREEQMD